MPSAAKRLGAATAAAGEPRLGLIAGLCHRGAAEGQLRQMRTSAAARRITGN